MTLIRLGGWILAGFVLLVPSLGCEGVRSSASDGRAESDSARRPESGSPQAVDGVADVSARDIEALIGAIAAREYWAGEVDESIQAANRRHDLRSHFEPTGVRVHSRTRSDGSPLVELQLARIGRGEGLVPVGPGVVRHDEARVEIERSELGLVESSVVIVEQFPGVSRLGGGRR
jgi:hypothetical protein